MKEYTILAASAAVAALVVDRLLGTRVTSRREYWAFLGVMVFFMLITNGYLTWRPIVLYGERFNLGLRLGTIPVEDFLYGFGFMTLAVSIWERLTRRASPPSSLHELTRRMVIPRSLHDTFAFFDAPENLARITPVTLGFTIRTPSPVAMREDAVIDYTIRWAGLPLRWTTLIAAYEPPLRFIDEQVRGPYRFWRHTHTFRAVGGGTEVTDRVQYLLPFGVFGRLLHALAVRRQLEAIFDYRTEQVRRLLVADAKRVVP